MPPKKKAKKAKEKEIEESDEEARPKGDVRRRKDCPDCGSENVTFDIETEQLICQDCGLIFEELPGDEQAKYHDEDII